MSNQKKPFKLKTREGTKAGTVFVEISKDLLKEWEQWAEEQGYDLYDKPLEQTLPTFYKEDDKQFDESQAVDVTFDDNTVDGADIGELFSAEDLEKKTDLSPQQILAFARAKTFAQRYNSQTLNVFLKNYGEYAVSKNRKGRSEFVEAFKIKVLEPMGLGGINDDKKEK